MHELVYWKGRRINIYQALKNYMSSTIILHLLIKYFREGIYPLFTDKD